MKNKLLILLIAFMFAGCGDAVGQEPWGDACKDESNLPVDRYRCYEFKGRFTYTGRSVTWSGAQSKQAQAQASWCANPNFTPGAKYDRYTVKFHRVFSTEYEGDKYVLAGTDPRLNDNAFPGVNGVGYFFENPDAAKTISAIEIQASNGTAPTSSANRIKIECPTDIIEIGNTVEDNSSKINTFYNSCGDPITNTMNVDIIDNRVWVVDEAFYLDGGNLYYRVKESEWIKIDTSGFIVDTININCQSSDILVCTDEYLIPIGVNSMKNTAGMLGIPQDSTAILGVMGDIIGKAPPVNFPDDFRGFSANVYAYADGAIISEQSCAITVPSAYQEMLIYLVGDKNIFSGMSFCDNEFNVSFELVGGTETFFALVGDCNPSYESKGNIRVAIDLIENTLPATRQNRVIMSSDAFEISFVITQKGSGQDPVSASLRSHLVESSVCNSGVMQTVWYDANLYANPLVAPIYTNAELTNLAFSSWYSDGTDYRHWNGSSWDTELEFCP